MTPEPVAGFAAPFRIENGSVAWAAGGTKLPQNLRTILLTGVGERVMRREYGGGVRELVHDPNNDAIRAIIQHQVGKSIGQWEPRVLVQQLKVRQAEASLYVDVQYVVRQTRQTQGVSVALTEKRGG